MPSFTICVLFLFHFVHMVIAAKPLTHVCSPDSSNLTSNGPYKQNLKKLIGRLYYGARRDGFGMESVGQLENQTFGLSLCRGDVSRNDCAACVVNASAEIRQLCPNNEAATICAGMINVGGSQKLYGLVQCTQDLSTADCKTCLDAPMLQLPGCCDGKDGGRVPELQEQSLRMIREQDEEEEDEKSGLSILRWSGKRRQKSSKQANIFALRIKGFKQS
nr:cysteine-rich repeat secretory protein 38-like [Tanacetum cinerariifolium]